MNSSKEIIFDVDQQAKVNEFEKRVWNEAIEAAAKRVDIWYGAPSAVRSLKK